MQVAGSGRRHPGQAILGRRGRVEPDPLQGPIDTSTSRDRIPELAAANGQPGSLQQATEAEFARWLRAKLLEEAQEAATASPTTLAEELGDVLQVLYALAELAGLEPAAIECARGAQGPHSRHLHAPHPLAPTT